MAALRGLAGYVTAQLKQEFDKRAVLLTDKQPQRIVIPMQNLLPKAAGFNFQRDSELADILSQNMNENGFQSGMDDGNARIPYAYAIVRRNGIAYDMEIHTNAIVELSEKLPGMVENSRSIATAIDYSNDNRPRGL